MILPPGCVQPSHGSRCIPSRKSCTVCLSLPMPCAVRKRNALLVFPRLLRSYFGTLSWTFTYIGLMLHSRRSDLPIPRVFGITQPERLRLLHLSVALTPLALMESPMNAILDSHLGKHAVFATEYWRTGGLRIYHHLWRRTIRRII